MTSPPTQSSSSSSLTTRFRSGSSTTSLLLSPSPNTSRSSTPQPRQPSYRPRYHNRSRSSIPSNNSVKPRVLPFPDLPVRPISRDGSRAGSPTRVGMTSPGWTPRGSSTNLHEGRAISPRGSASGAGGVPMMVGGSMEGTGSDRGEGSSTARRESRTRFDLGSQSTSPTSTSPLGYNASTSTPHLGLSASTFRPRALTSPAPVDIPRSLLPPASTSLSASVSPSSSSAIYTSSEPTSSSHLSAPPSNPLSPSTAHRLPSSPSRPPPTPAKDLPRPPKNPHTTTSRLSAVPITPAQPIQPLQDHLYRSFLSGECADVRLWVKKWGIAWHVHKMVLVQAGFFHSLFLGGFSEMNMMSARLSPASRKGKGKAGSGGEDGWTGDDVELRFDDPNITRPAFELCLSRLYSPYPHLHFPLSLLPTTAHPLTPSYPSLEPIPISPDLSTETHLATPNLLLSLLATTIYLGHAPLMREVLGMVLRTIGVGTVGLYLRFALGTGIGEEGIEEEVRGLEGVGREMKGLGDDEEEDEVEESISHQRDTPVGDDTAYRASHRDSTASTESRPDEEVKVGSVPTTSYVPVTAVSVTAGGVTRTISNASTIRPTTGSGRLGMTAPANDPTTTTPLRHEQNDPQAHSNTDGTAHPTEDDTSFHSLDTSTMPHFYGYVSNKIGEACACWLARWGMDILAAELSISSFTKSDTSDQAEGVRREDVSIEGGYRIFRHRGLPAHFLRGLLSSDTLWVKGGEMGRYRAIREILDLRRRRWEAELGSENEAAEREEEDDERWEEWEEDEVELGRVLAEGVYYQHMSFDDLSIIANDIDPNTSLPYAPLPVLQAAHWAAADLKSRILASDPATSSSATDSAELGLVVTASDLVEAMKKGKRRVTPRSRVVSPTNSESSVNIGRKGGEDRSGLYASIRRVPSTAFSPESTGAMGRDTVYHPIPTDDTHRAGAGGLTFLSTSTHAGIDDRNAGPSATGIGGEGISHAGEGGWWSDEDKTNGTGKKKIPPASEKTFFGLLNPSITSSEIISSSSPSLSSFPYSPPPSSIGSTARYTPTQPFRFSVEFHNLHTLPEKERLYSTTHFHAGSWWNVYVQTIRKKDKCTTQLGVYLHRQNKKDGVPRASRPRTPAIGARAREGGEVLEARGMRIERSRRDRRSEGDLPDVQGEGTPPGLSTSMSRLGLAGTGSGQGRSLASASTLALGSNSGIGMDGEEDMFGEETYLDGRRVTRAYFSITCTSALGTALIRFSSSPDTFTLSQSWGWKSSALRSEEYLGVSSTSKEQLGQRVEVGAGADRGVTGEGQGGRVEDGVLGWVGDVPQGDGLYGAGKGSLRATVVVGII